MKAAEERPSQEDVDSGYLFGKFSQRSALSVNRFWLRDRVLSPQFDDDQGERIQLIGGTPRRTARSPNPKNGGQRGGVQYITLLY